MGILHTARWNRKGMSGSFANPNWVAFHRRIIEQHFARGQVQLLRVAAGETTLGVIYSFIWRGQVYMLQTGFAAATDNNQRPGYIAHCMAMALNGHNGLEVYDFMCGDADYKQSLASEASPMVWARLRKHTLSNSVEDLFITTYRFARKSQR
jgi:CelD/BcsL family acetyltransferase involved in cellulose biosynthesis